MCTQRAQRPFGQRSSQTVGDLSGIGTILLTFSGDPLAKRLVPLLPSAKLVLMCSRSTPNPAEPGALWLPTPCTDGELMAQVRQAQD